MSFCIFLVEMDYVCLLSKLIVYVSTFWFQNGYDAMQAQALAAGYIYIDKYIYIYLYHMWTFNAKLGSFIYLFCAKMLLLYSTCYCIMDNRILYIYKSLLVNIHWSLKEGEESSTCNIMVQLLWFISRVVTLDTSNICEVSNTLYRGL